MVGNRNNMNMSQSNNRVIAVGFLVAYDYAFLYHALPLVYADSDKIVLTIDSGYKTLTGKNYQVDPFFFDWVKTFDTENKISWLRKAFYNEDLSPTQVIMCMRNEMLNAMSPADWYVQLDSDEYFLDFKGFVQYLKQMPHSDHIQLVLCKWRTLFKQTPGGYLTIGGTAEEVPIAINRPHNTSERSHNEATIIQSQFFILHQSWARSRDEIAKKIVNWSHTLDFNTDEFYGFWMGCNERNYRWQRHFHPLHPPIWPFLEFVPASSIDALIDYYIQYPPMENSTPLLPWHLRLKNKFERIFSSSRCL